MNFGQALDALRLGGRVCRSGWNGKNMWLVYVPGTNGVVPAPGTPYSKALTNDGVTPTININPHIDMMTAQGSMQPGWLASQTDMLADDWEVML